MAYIDFKKLKARVSLAEILDHYQTDQSPRPAEGGPRPGDPASPIFEGATS